MTETVPVNNAGGVNTGARHPCKPLSPHSAPPLPHDACPASARPCACAGKFCASEQGVGADNPVDPLNLDAVQKRKTVSFFYEGQSEFLVRVGPGASPRSPYHRSPLAPSQPLSARNCTVRRSRSAPLAAWAGVATSLLAAKQHKLTNAPRRRGRRRMPHCRPHLPRHGRRSHHRRLPRHHLQPHLPRQSLHAVNGTRITITLRATSRWTSSERA